MIRCPHSRGKACTPTPYFSTFVEGRRGEILDAAMSVFAEKGYEGGTMREIASRLGVTEPALYRHYAGKEALFEDLVSVAGERLVTGMGAMFESLDPTAIHDSLIGIIEARRIHSPSDDSAKPVMQTLFTAAPHNAAFREVFRTHVARPMVARLQAFVPRVDAHFGIERTPQEMASSLRAFVSLFVGYFMTGLMLELPDDDEAIVAAMMAIMGWDGTRTA